MAVTLTIGMADELHSERVWRGTNGSSLRGTFIRSNPRDGRIEILTAGGKVVSIQTGNLSEADRSLVTAPNASVAAADKPGDLSDFKSIPVTDRDRLPVISQEDYGNKASDCVPSSFCNFLLWWDQTGILEIPKRGDFEAKAEWIHSRLSRYCVTRNNSGTGVENALEGFKKYFEEDLAGLATMKTKVDYDLRPQNLARYVSGENATMLDLTIREAPRHDSGHWVALVSASPDGEIVFHTWGARFTGRIEVLETKPSRVVHLGNIIVPDITYQIRISNPNDLPEWFRSGNRQLILDPANWNSIVVLKPYIYAQKGGLAKAPAEPLLDPTPK